MKSIVAAVLLLMLLQGSVNSQSVDQPAMTKNKSLALMYGTVFPGAGLIYADRVSEAAIFIPFEIATFFWATSADDGTETVPFVIFGGLKFLELVRTGKAVDEYNASVQVQPSMIGMGRIQLRLTVVL